MDELERTGRSARSGSQVRSDPPLPAGSRGQGQAAARVCDATPSPDVTPADPSAWGRFEKHGKNLLRDTLLVPGQALKWVKFDRDQGRLNGSIQQ